MKINSTKFEEFIGLIWILIIFSPIFGIEYFRFTPYQAIGLTLLNMVVLGFIGIFFASIYYTVKEEAEKKC